MGMLGRVSMLCLAWGCAPKDEAPTESEPEPTPEVETEDERMVESRPDLSECSERTSPVYEEPTDNESYWEQVDIPLCAGDQLGFRLTFPGYAAAAEIIVREGSIDDVSAQLAFSGVDVPFEVDGDRLRTLNDVGDPCETWTLPIEVLATPDAEPVRFDILLVDSGERCSGTG